jgi:hypothetical protein
MMFLKPEILWWLAVVPPLAVAFIWYAYRRQKRFIEKYGEWRLIGKFSERVPAGRYVVKALALSLALAAVIVALARPFQRDARLEYPIGTVDVVAIVDVSRSMASPDYKGKIPGKQFADGTRLDMARYLLQTDVMPALGYNQLGVVAFAGTAFPKAFLTDDMPSLQWQMNRSLTIGSVPGDGSQLADALTMAAILFDLDSPATHRRVVILFSDGGNDSNDTGTIAAMKELKKRNIDLIIAGLGSREPQPIPIKLLSPSDQAQFSGEDFYMLDGQVARTALDEPMLIAVKNAIGGRYVRVDTASDFRIGSLISGVDVKYVKGDRELFMYPLYAALFLTLLALVSPRRLSQFNWRRTKQSGQKK